MSITWFCISLLGEDSLPKWKIGLLMLAFDFAILANIMPILSVWYVGWPSWYQASGSGPEIHRFESCPDN